MCSNCGHTFVLMHQGQLTTIFHCPRCGTLLIQHRSGEVRTDTPELVERCRKFEATFPPGNPPSVSYSAEWNRLGIDECINLPK